MYREEILLTESVIDALSLIRLGLRGVVACYGTSGFTEEHEKLLREERVATVAIGFDSDEAGRRGAKELAARLSASGIAVKLVAPPKGKDWNEYLTGGGSLEDVKALIHSAPLVASDIAERELVVTTERERTVFSIGGIRYRLAGARDLFVASLRVNLRAEAGGKPVSRGAYSLQPHGSGGAHLHSQIRA